jgi:hypothetical protein
MSNKISTTQYPNNTDSDSKNKLETFISDGLQKCNCTQPVYSMYLFVYFLVIIIIIFLLIEYLKKN